MLVITPDLPGCPCTHFMKPYVRRKVLIFYGFWWCDLLLVGPGFDSWCRHHCKLYAKLAIFRPPTRRFFVLVLYSPDGSRRALENCQPHTDMSLAAPCLGSPAAVSPSECC